MEQRGSTAAVITGSSTHNQRIERLWRDVHRCVAVLFHDTIYLLEHEDKLDPLNEIDLYCLHYVYLPRIQSALQSFIESLNNHSISTEHSLTPNQLFIRGALQQNMIPHVPQLQNEGSNSIRPHSLPSATSQVQVPRSNFTPCEVLVRRLTSSITPLAESDDFGCKYIARQLT